MKQIPHIRVVIPAKADTQALLKMLLDPDRHRDDVLALMLAQTPTRSVRIPG